MAAQNFHATCVAFPDLNPPGILITGPAGSGKSGLALQLLERGGRLVSDDQTILTAAAANSLQATPPEGLRGLIEVRGYGIVQLPEAKLAPAALLGLYVKLLPPGAAVERMPDQVTEDILGVPLRRLTLRAFDPAGAAKIFAALSYRLLDYPHG